MGIYDRPYYRNDDLNAKLSPSWDQKSAISTLIIINVVVFVVCLMFSTRQTDLQDLLSLSTLDATRPWDWWRLLSYGFVHSKADISHILLNMFSLWGLGRSVEDRYGRTEFLRQYLFAIVGCGILFLLFRVLAGKPASVCGASGAVSFVTILFVLNFPFQNVMLFGVFPVQAWVLGLFIVGLNIVGSANGTTGPEAGIAWDVHLFGAGLAALYFYFNWNFAALSSPFDAIRKWRRRLFGPQLKAFRPDVAVSESEQADGILDKIHRLGQDSLSNKERKFMIRYSEKMRKQREEDSD